MAIEEITVIYSGMSAVFEAMEIGGKYIFLPGAAYTCRQPIFMPGGDMMKFKILLAAIIVLTLLDVGCTYWGILLAGPVYEQSPVVLWLVGHLGRLPGLGLVCLWTVACAGLILAAAKRREIKWAGPALWAVAGVKGLIVVSHAVVLSNLLA